MNHKLLSSLTASLLVATFGLPLTASAKSPETSNQDSDSSLKQANSEPSSEATAELPGSFQSNAAKLDKQSNEVVKVGEQQSQTATQASPEVIATVQPHEIAGRKAATLYVRNIPILTFLGNRQATPDGVKMGAQVSQLEENSAKTKSLSRAKPFSSVTTLFRSSQALADPDSSEFKLEALNDRSAETDPIWRASVIAARINQLNRDGITADSITIRRANQRQDFAQNAQFVIQANAIAIATIDGNTILPDSTRNLEKDVLQATNRLRRILGNATPLTEIGGSPSQSGQELVFGPIRMRLTGWASWYGPGFHGNPSASGERFNQHAFTAAHRTLPFGTRVLVTNLDNGQSVVVRINDRGPFHGNRVIDLSTGAARVLGLIQAGVARVQLDVIDSRSAAAVGN